MLKVLDKAQSQMVRTMNKRVTLIKNEDIAYVGSFLSIIRNKLIPFHSKSLKYYPKKGIIKIIFTKKMKLINFTGKHITKSKIYT